MIIPYDNPAVEDLLLKLADRLKNLGGKKVYGYLPPDAKATVDLIVDELAKDDRIAALYDLWYEQRQTVVSTYTDKPVERLPLSQNDDFKPVKNAVIEEAMNIVLDRLTFEDTALDDAESGEQEQTDQEPDVPEPPPKMTGGKTDNKFKLYRKAKALLDKDSPEYDPQAAIPLLLQSAQQDYEWAQYRLGKIFLQGDPVERDIEYGLRWLREAEAQNNQYAQILLARTYLKGEMVEQDILAAEVMFEKAAAQDNSDAQYALAKMHLNGQAAIPSVIRAVELLDKSANGSNEWAQYTLGKLLMRGELVPKDMTKAEKLLLAAVQPRRSRDEEHTPLPGNQYAAYLLGKLYLSEDGVPKDAPKAVRYLSDSAEQGNQYAQYQLGKMLLWGKEIEPDIERGLALLTASAAQGNQYAEKAIRSYYDYTSRAHGNASMSAALGSLRLLGHLARIMKNRLDEEERRDGSVGLIDRKLRRKIEEKKQAHGLRFGD